MFNIIELLFQIFHTNFYNDYIHFGKAGFHLA